MIELDQIPAPRQRRRKGVMAPSAAGRAAVYARVSTSEQADDGSSLASQEAACRELCARKGLEVVAVYSDAGVSGGTLERPALTELRAAVAAGDVALVAVYAIDRLSRSQLDFATLLAELGEHGAGVASASQDFDLSSAMGRMVAGILASIAEWQRDEIRGRTKRALATKAANGIAVGRLPLGLRRTDDGGYERDPEHWPIVERVLAESAAGKSTTELAEELNADGVPSPQAARGECRSGIINTTDPVWSAAAVARLRRNPRIREIACADGAGA